MQKDKNNVEEAKIILDSYEQSFTTYTYKADDNDDDTLIINEQNMFFIINIHNSIKCITYENYHHMKIMHLISLN